MEATQDVKVDANSSTEDIVKAAGEQQDTGAEGAQESGAAPDLDRARLDVELLGDLALVE